MSWYQRLKSKMQRTPEVRMPAFQILRLQPNDTIVVSLPESMSAYVLPRLIAAISRSTGHPEKRILLVDGGVQISIIRSVSSAEERQA